MYPTSIIQADAFVSVLKLGMKISGGIHVRGIDMY